MSRCDRCNARIELITLQETVARSFTWINVVDYIQSDSMFFGLCWMEDLSFGSTDDLVDFTLRMPFTVPCGLCPGGAVKLDVRCTALLPMEFVDGHNRSAGAVRYDETPPADMWRVEVEEHGAAWKFRSCEVFPISKDEIRGQLVSALTDIRSLTLYTLNLLYAMWEEIESAPNHRSHFLTTAAISDDDLRLLPCTAADPTTLSMEQAKEISLHFRQCELDPVSGCWRYPTKSHATKQYSHVMRAKELYGRCLSTAEQRSLFIYAHAGLPHLVDKVEPKDGDSRLVRHHPLRCELFHPGDHGRCIRPSHLAWGDNKKQNKPSHKQSNKADQWARERATAYLLRKLGATTEMADECYSEIRPHHAAWLNQP
jgi:hypothetical protein